MKYRKVPPDGPSQLSVGLEVNEHLDPGHLVRNTLRNLIEALLDDDIFTVRHSNLITLLCDLKSSSYYCIDSLVIDYWVARTWFWAKAKLACHHNFSQERWTESSTAA